MSSLQFQQIIYTSFDQLGFQLITGPQVSDTLKTIFMEKVVHQYWNAYNPPGKNFQLNYLYQISRKNILFGWMFIDDQDELGRQNIPYFVSYYLTSPLDSVSLNLILTCLERGPMQMLDRCFPLEFLENIEIQHGELAQYKPVRKGVSISSDARQQCLTLLQQGELLSLLCSTEEQVSIQPLIENAFFQASIPHNKPTVTAPSSQRILPDFSFARIQTLFSLSRIQSLFSVPHIQLRFPSVTELPRKYLLLGGLIIAGGLSALLLPQVLSKNSSAVSQNFDVIPEKLTSDRNGSEDLVSDSTNLPKPKSLPEKDGSSPLQTRLNQNPLPDPALLSPFSDVNLASDSEFPGLSNFSTNTPNKKQSSAASSPNPRPSTKNTPKQESPSSDQRLFSSFDVQGSSPSAESSNAPSASPSASEPIAPADPQPTISTGGGDSPPAPSAPEAIAHSSSAAPSPAPTKPLPSVSLPPFQPELPPTTAPGMEE
jgi:hypothetical protein